MLIGKSSGNLSQSHPGTQEHFKLVAVEQAKRTKPLFQAKNIFEFFLIFLFLKRTSKVEWALRKKIEKKIQNSSKLKCSA